jgi:hypothetical protein
VNGDRLIVLCARHKRRCTGMPDAAGPATRIRHMSKEDALAELCDSQKFVVRLEREVDREEAFLALKAARVYAPS